MVDVAAKAQLLVEKLVQLTQLVQGVRLGHQATLELGAELVYLAQHLLNVQAGVFVLGQADRGFQQGKLVIALHQGGEVVECRGQL